jgi:hypothetical protein
LSSCSDQPASPGLFYDFSFASGFLNTDLFSTYNFVTAYYVDAPEPASFWLLLTTPKPCDCRCILATEDRESSLASVLCRES